jgi:molecular chaperone GrpE
MSGRDGETMATKTRRSASTPDEFSADNVDEASCEPFPASDPPARTSVVGERAATPGPESAAPKKEGGGEDVVARLKQEMAKLRDRLLRALAEQENLRRRAAREREDAVRFAASGFARDLLPVADNLRRAIDSMPIEFAATDQWAQDVAAGIIAAEKALLDAFELHGIARIDPLPGEPFDPHRHQAMFEVTTSALPADTVAQVLQPGYAPQNGCCARLWSASLRTERTAPPRPPANTPDKETAWPASDPCTTASCSSASRPS